jgi:hypothetical protein
MDFTCEEAARERNPEGDRHERIEGSFDLAGGAVERPNSPLFCSRGKGVVGGPGFAFGALRPFFAVADFVWVTGVFDFDGDAAFGAA